VLYLLRFVFIFCSLLLHFCLLLHLFVVVVAAAAAAVPSCCSFAHHRAVRSNVTTQQGGTAVIQAAVEFGAEDYNFSYSDLSKFSAAVGVSSLFVK